MCIPKGVIAIFDSGIEYGVHFKHGGIWYDGYYCADASDYEEAEMEYWNTH